MNTTNTTENKNNCTDDLLDMPENRLAVGAETESQGTGRNTILETHPYICGYAFLFAIIFLFSFSSLSMFLISFLFLYFISDFITNDVRRFAPFLPKAFLFSFLYVAVILFVILASNKIIPETIRQLPDIAQRVQTQAIEQYADIYQRWHLQKYADKYINPEEVRSFIIKGTTTALQFVMDQVKPVYMGVIYFIFALVINLLFYHNKEQTDRVFARKPRSLMFFLYRFAEMRIRVFYFYFKRVMIGQIIISTINTSISAIAILSLELPNPLFLVFIVFLCGLFPVVGNIASNTILTIIAFVSVGLWGAFICLGLLVVIHKLEYFLNSKIISGIVNLPMVVTLSALVILAIPMLLFIRHELEHLPGMADGPAVVEAKTECVQTVFPPVEK
jgi:predicted PurR-regulated permease PerM